MARKRMIDPGIWDSEQVQTLTPAQFKLYVYMITQSDDSGRCKVSVPLFRARVHPLNNYSAEALKADLEILDTCGLMASYFVDGEWFMHHPHWNDYQYIQKPKPSKLPVPDEYNTHTVPVPTNGIELNRIELNGMICAEPGIPTRAPDSTPPVSTPPQRTKLPEILFNFGEKAWERISDEQVAAWSDVYPALKIEIELGKAREWILANPTKKKKNWRRFLVNWFGRAQERGGDKPWKK